jgi:hypothetical protein
LYAACGFSAVCRASNRSKIALPPWERPGGTSARARGVVHAPGLSARAHLRRGAVDSALGCAEPHLGWSRARVRPVGSLFRSGSIAHCRCGSPKFFAPRAWECQAGRQPPGGPATAVALPDRMPGLTGDRDRSDPPSIQGSWMRRLPRTALVLGTTATLRLADVGQAASHQPPAAIIAGRLPFPRWTGIQTGSTRILRRVAGPRCRPRMSRNQVAATQLGADSSRALPDRVGQSPNPGFLNPSPVARAVSGTHGHR